MSADQRKAASALALMIGALGATHCYAQAQPQPPSGGSAPEVSLDTVIVTATKTGSTQAQKTPLAMSVLTGERLNASLANNIKDLTELTPSLNISQATTSAQIYIRGVGSNNVFNGSDADVTVQVDGVYISRPFAQFFDFSDIERIEVLRGPQGTIYGRNAVGGTLNILTRKPTDDFRAQMRVTGGDYNLGQVQSYISGPIVAGKVDASISGNFIRHDGYVHNLVPTSPDLNDANRGGARAQIRLTPTDRVELITRLDWSSSDEHFDSYDQLLAPVHAIQLLPGAAPPTPVSVPLANSTVGDYHLAAIDTDQRSKTQLWGVSEEMNFELSEALKLKSITAYRRSANQISTEADGTEYPGITAAFDTAAKQFSQEFNLTAKWRGFEGVTGLYYFNEQEHTLISLANSSITPPFLGVLNTLAGDIQSETHSYAAFIQGDLHFTNQLSMIAGIRYTEDRKHVFDVQTGTFVNPLLAALGHVPANVSLPLFTGNLTRTFDAATPKFGVNYQLTDDVLLYVSATRGFKSGGSNFSARSLPALSFGPETMWAYEAGLKSDWFDRRLRFNANGFRYDYRDLQVTTTISPGNLQIANAAAATINGLEFELSGKPTPNWLLALNYTLLDATYDSFPQSTVTAALVPYVTKDPHVNPGCSALACTYNAAGKILNAAPHDTVSANVEYEHPFGPAGRAFIRGQYYWTSRVYYDPSNVLIDSQKPYSLINLSVGYDTDDGKWGIQFLAKNILDTQYLIAIGSNGAVPGGLAGAPRTFAVQLTRNW